MASKWPVVDEHSIKKKLLKETHKTADRDVINEIHQTDARQQERRDSGLNGRYSIDIPFLGVAVAVALLFAAWRLAFSNRITVGSRSGRSSFCRIKTLLPFFSLCLIATVGGLGSGGSWRFFVWRPPRMEKEKKRKRQSRLNSPYIHFILD
jgi:hypothetical protein